MLPGQPTNRTVLIILHFLSIFGMFLFYVETAYTTKRTNNTHWQNSRLQLLWCLLRTMCKPSFPRDDASSSLEYSLGLSGNHSIYSLVCLFPQYAYAMRPPHERKTGALMRTDTYWLFAGVCCMYEGERGRSGNGWAGAIWEHGVCICPVIAIHTKKQSGWVVIQAWYSMMPMLEVSGLQDLHFWYTPNT